MFDPRSVAQALNLSFYQCPNSGRILEGYQGDDKVVCNCGRPNTAAPYETVQGGLVHHVRRYLPAASLEDYMRQGRRKV